MLGKTLLRRVDRRWRLAGGKLPRDVELPGGQWRPLVREHDRIVLYGYGDVIEITTAGRGRWHVSQLDAETNARHRLTADALAFDDAWQYAVDYCEAIRSRSLGEVNTAAASTPAV
jgi:hypothetical protein